TSMTERVPMSTSCVVSPMKEKTSVLASDGTVNEKAPPASVMVPMVVPFTTTFAPATEAPSSDDFTDPEMVRSWAKTGEHSNTEVISKKRLPSNGPVEVFFIGYILG